MLQEKCTSIDQAIATASRIAKKWGDGLPDPDPTLDVWFRGANDTFDLLPSAYWRTRGKEYEYSAFATFKQLARNVSKTSGFSKWDYYCLARHHGIPTRLLDWSEGILQALFFALDGWDGSGTPCIWILRPDALNQLSLELDLILASDTETERGRATEHWLPELEPNGKINIDGNHRSNEKPIAIYPARTNPRIVGQRGTFTVHGTDTRPLNEILCAEPEFQDSLARIDLEGLDRDITRRTMHYLGLRQSAIYPDADHIAKDIRFIYGWGD